jgi:hypothetical protein
MGDVALDVAQRRVHGRHVHLRPDGKRVVDGVKEFEAAVEPDVGGRLVSPPMKSCRREPKLVRRDCYGLMNRYRQRVRGVSACRANNH